MDVPVNVPIDDPNADTEWNDILRNHGIIPPKPPSPTPIIQEALREAAQRAHENRLEDKDLDELNELEDEEDGAFLNKYRQQRMAELATISKASKFNQVYPLQKPDYSRDVTEASNEAFVFVNMTSSLGTNTESRLVTELWRQLAPKFGDVKFYEIRANLCVEGYPERNTPTILVYKDGDIKKQLITLRELRGSHTTIEDMQKLLVDVGAVKEKDHRLLQRRSSDDSHELKSLRSTNLKATGDDDDDWD